MQQFYFNYSETGFFSKLILDYLKGETFLKPFYSYPPALSSFEMAIEKRQQPLNRDVLVKVLKQQYTNINNSTYALAFQNIELLLNSKTFTVTTGHQLCLFTGPLYLPYKIISTILLAEQLQKQYPKYHFVPVFWMASEDHDFEEINHIHLFGKTILWSQKQGGAVGKYKNEGLREVIDEIKNGIGNSKNAEELIDLFEKAYLKEKNLADATRVLLHELFGKYGLVIIDGNDTSLKKEFAHIMQDDIVNNTPFQIVSQTNEKLYKRYKVQVNPREINCFYLQDNKRERIVKKENHFITEIAEHPERFSPNVILRPLYQEKILPNIVVVGGAAEISYWLQLKDLFEYYHLHFPVLVLRNSVMWVNRNTYKKMQALKIQPTDLFQDINLLVTKYIKENTDNAIDLQQEKEKIKVIYDNLISKIEKTDSTLSPYVKAEWAKHLKSIENIENKLVKAEKRKQKTNSNNIVKIKEKLFPNNTLQERYDNFIPYYLLYGKDFLNILKENLQPLANDLLVLMDE